ncbi:hypothetical protein SEA_CHERRYONLIM_42 [Gordonia phage CherryonLim]|uniref:Uncharacterized protein n=1 Tax=Gordonia phage CherryonLim TaxID=2652411 RepID=A0A5P8D9X1_9CAUD|nr:hypothetical protein PP994_gp42 [Gordonia phage CherryonLim]QFP95795.1 hypothetical protein SEA_CHERRYONLIM_42 [Gordonia phage CherryonLim]
MVENTGVTWNANKPLVAKIDFANIEEGSGIRPKRLKPGEYAATIKDVQGGLSKKSKTPQWVFLISPDSHPGAVYPYYCQLTADAAWKIRLLLLALGATVPKSVKAVDASKLKGKKLGIILEDDEYEGKLKSVIDTLIPVSEITDEPAGDVEDDEDDDVEEEEAPPARKRTAKKKVEPEPVEDEDDDSDDLDLDDL